MNPNNYESTKEEILRKITAQKTIYKFRTFLYSVSKDIRHKMFDLSKEYIQNELQSVELTGSEYNRIHSLLHHWNWHEFETAGMHWWYVLTLEHYKSTTLMTLIHHWIDDITVFDPDDFETSTQNLT